MGDRGLDAQGSQSPDVPVVFRVPAVLVDPRLGASLRGWLPLALSGARFLCIVMFGGHAARQAAFRVTHHVPEEADRSTGRDLQHSCHFQKSTAPGSSEVPVDT